MDGTLTDQQVAIANKITANQYDNVSTTNIITSRDKCVYINNDVLSEIELEKEKEGRSIIDIILEWLFTSYYEKKHDKDPRKVYCVFCGAFRLHRDPAALFRDQGLQHIFKRTGLPAGRGEQPGRGLYRSEPRVLIFPAPACVEGPRDHGLFLRDPQHAGAELYLQSQGSLKETAGFAAHPEPEFFQVDGV